MIRWRTGNRRDVVVTTSPGDQTGCRILQRLESLKINIRDPDQNVRLKIDGDIVEFLLFIITVSSVVTEKRINSTTVIISVGFFRDFTH